MRHFLFVILLLAIASACENEQAQETAQAPQTETQAPDSIIYIDKYGNQFRSAEKLSAPEISEEDLDFPTNEKKLRAYLTNNVLTDTGTIITSNGLIFSEHFFSEEELHAVLIYKVEFDSVEVEFYENLGKKWTLIQKFGPLENVFDVDLSFADYNGDKIRDLLIYAGHGARPSNYRHNLLLIDPNKKRLIHIPEFAELPQPRYDSIENSITAVYRHGTWHSHKFIWEKYQLVLTEYQSCIFEPDTLFRSITTINGTIEKEVRVDTLSAELAKEDCFACGPEPWDERFGKYRQ